MECVLVSHTHWDREWYRTFQAFRARLVDTVDSVLDLIASDPGYKFLLDGQAVILEDYLEIRPHRRPELERAVEDGRVAIGPWYVQPDSLMPSGEAHVRNLLEGRRVAAEFGPVSQIAYTPDSFGHPAQFPQIFQGFGLRAFVYWRGNGAEIDELPSDYEWLSPDGTGILACHLYKGYGNISALPIDVAGAVERIRPVVEELSARTPTGRVLLMNGSDHLLPDPHTGDVARALAAATGWKVDRGLLEDFVAPIGDRLPRFSGELLGARVAHLLPGVWSTRTYLKLRNRRCEALLEGWAEPWSALGRILGTPDERPSLRLAWRSLLHNQAHDSICGCSQDGVHEQMLARYDSAEEISTETTTRVLERLAGLGPERRVPWEDSLAVAVFNPSPHSRTDVVQLPLDGYPPFGASTEGELAIHPLVIANLLPRGFTVDGQPAMKIPDLGNRRVRLLPDQQDLEIEFVAQDVPPFGYKIFQLAPAEESLPISDDGREISNETLSLVASDDGTLSLELADREYEGLAALEDVGDRGDTYDFDPVPGNWRLKEVQFHRHRHPNGIQRLEIRRTLSLPAGLDEHRRKRGGEFEDLVVSLTARLAQGVDRLDLAVSVQNNVGDHRLRILFPTGAPAGEFVAATTFDVARRSTAPADDSRWVHAAPKTFPSQGWVSANGLTVAAPGLYETEVTPQGTIAVTLVRAVGWLSRPDLSTRPGPAGPSLATPGAQCLGWINARISLMAADGPRGRRGPRDAELGLRAVAAGPTPLLEPGRSLVSLDPPTLILSALKPAEEGNGIVMRLVNPTSQQVEASLVLGFPISKASIVRLDESPTKESALIDDETVKFAVRPHQIVSVLLN